MRGVLQSLTKSSICLDVLMHDDSLYILYNDHIEIRGINDFISYVDIRHHPIHFINNFVLADNGLYTLEGTLYKPMLHSCLYSDYIGDTLVVANSSQFCLDHFNSVTMDDFETVDALIVNLALLELDEDGIYIAILTAANNKSSILLYKQYTKIKEIHLDTICHCLVNSDYLLAMGSSSIIEIQIDSIDDIQVHNLPIVIKNPISLVNDKNDLYVLNAENTITQYNKSTGTFMKHSIEAGCYGKLINNKLYCWSEFLPISQIDLNSFEIMQMDHRYIQWMYNDKILLNNQIMVVNEDQRHDIHTQIDSADNPILNVFLLGKDYLMLSFMNGSRLLSLPDFKDMSVSMNIIVNEPTTFAFILKNSLIQITKMCINTISLDDFTFIEYTDSNPIDFAFVFLANLYFAQNKSIFIMDNGMPLLYCELPCQINFVSLFNDAIHVIHNPIYKVTNKFEFKELACPVDNISDVLNYDDLLLIGTKLGVLHVFNYTDNQFESMQTLEIGFLPISLENGFIISDVVYSFKAKDNLIVIDRILSNTPIAVYKYQFDHLLVYPHQIQIVTFYPEKCNFVHMPVEFDDKIIGIINNDVICATASDIIIRNANNMDIQIPHPKQTDPSKIKLAGFTTDPLVFIVEYPHQSILFKNNQDIIILPLNSHSLLFYKNSYFYCQMNSVYQMDGNGQINVLTCPSTINCMIQNKDMLIIGMDVGIYVYKLIDLNCVCYNDVRCYKIIAFKDYYVIGDDLGNIMGFRAIDLKKIFCVYLHSPILCIEIKNNGIYMTGVYGNINVIHMVEDENDLLEIEELIQIKTNRDRIYHYYYDSFGIVSMDRLKTKYGIRLRNKLMIK